VEPLVELAQALAAALQAQFPHVTFGGTNHAVTALWEAEPSFMLEKADLNDPKIWVVDLGEQLGGERAVGTEEFLLLTIIQQKLVAPSGDRAEQIAALGKFASAAGRVMRPINPEDAFVLTAADAAAVCTQVKRQPARNLEDSRKGLFYTELLTTWRSA
jgi:hypothetical protein